MLQQELKERRTERGLPLSACAEALNCSVEGYRLKEKGERPISGEELAKLADLYGLSIRDAFPSYEPTEGERALARHIKGVA